MHYRLLFIVLLLGHIHTAQAQCNPKQYTRIFQEATTLQEKGLFIEAKNTYEAAKIFACNQKEKDAADSRVDALFTQINRLRQQADSTAWTAYANDLAYKSAIALQAGDRNTAFRLAEFAHRYVEADNPGVLQALLDALYHQDIPTRPALPRVENLEGHSERVLSVACSPDGQWLATGGDDGLAIIWDLVSKKPIFSLFCFGTVNSLAFSPDGSQLATATGNHTTLIWDLYSGKTRQTLEGHDYRILGVAFSPDGKRLATASDDKTAIIWDIENGKSIRRLQGHTSGVTSVRFSPDGKHLATGSFDHTAKIWDAESGLLLRTLQGHTAIIYCLAFSPDGRQLATGSNDHSANLWDLDSGILLQKLEGHTGGVWSIDFSPTGKFVATGSSDQDVMIWELDNPKSRQVLKGHMDRVTSVAFSPNGQFLVTGSYDHTAKIWNLKTGPAAVILTNPTGNIYCVASAPLRPGEKQRIAFGSSDRTAKIWDIASGELIRTLTGHTSLVACVAFSPDGRLLATGSYDKTAKIWEVETGKLLQTLEGHTAWVNGVAFSPEGKYLATGSGDFSGNDHTTKIWELGTGKVVRSLDSHGAGILGIAYSPDGQLLAACTGNNVEIWNPESGVLVHTLACDALVWNVAFSPDGHQIGAVTLGGFARIWELGSGKAVFTLHGHTESASGISFMPAMPNAPRKTQRLATASADKTVKIWDSETGNQLITLEGHTDFVLSVAFSADGQKLITGAGDNTAKIWEITDDGLLLRWLETGEQADLILAQLQRYNLNALLDQHPDNEQKLIATGETWQIKAFADLAASQAAGSNILARVAPHYARADRLYAAALALQDEALIRMDYAKMLRSWAAVYQSDGQAAKAAELETKADGIWIETKN